VEAASPREACPASPWVEPLVLGCPWNAFVSFTLNYLCKFLLLESQQTNPYVPPAFSFRDTDVSSCIPWLHLPWGDRHPLHPLAQKLNSLRFFSFGIILMLPLLRNLPQLQQA
jgi:hypothetical protein